MKHRPFLALLSLLSTLLATSGHATISGFSVSTHWAGVMENRTLFGGYGEIWRHNLVQGEVVEHVLLFPGPARNVVINYTGTHVAFIKQSGTIAYMPADGGEAVDLAVGHPEGCLDWPEGDWIYFSMGGWDQYESSRELNRVNAFTGVQEHVVTFESGTWRFGIARDHRRAAVRDTSVQHTIVAYDLVNDNGQMRAARAVDVPSCGTGMDPEGEYFIDGMWDHSGMDIRRWEDLEIVESFTHVDATGWGDRDSGEGHNRNSWSTNDQKWICAHIGWNLHFSSDSRGSNQVLYNWIDHKRIVVTGNSDESYTYDSAGDLWVNHHVENTAPVVDAGPDQMAGLSTALLLRGDAEDDGYPRSPMSFLWSQEAGPGVATFAHPHEPQTTVTFDARGEYVVRLAASDGELIAWDTATIIVGDVPGIVIVHPNGGEAWVAGETHDIEWRGNDVDDVVISYSSDDGATWTLVAPTVDTQSPYWESYPWLVPNTPSRQCLVAIAAYLGGQRVQSAAVFEIQGLPTDIELGNPVGGEVFAVGEETLITWSSDETPAVLLSFSDDGGTSWTPVNFVDRSSEQWGAYRWTVPDLPTTVGHVAVSDRDNWNSRAISGAFTIEAEEDTEPPGSDCGCSWRSGRRVASVQVVLVAAAMVAGLRRRRR